MLFDSINEYIYKVLRYVPLNLPYELLLYLDTGLGGGYCESTQEGQEIRLFVFRVKIFMK